MATRSQTVKQAEAYLGVKKGSAGHKEILSVYNKYVKAPKYKYSPAPRTHQVTQDEAWCATFVSTIGILTGNSSFPCECSCNNQIKQAQNAGTWQENDAYQPKEGDIIFYDWDDDGNGDNKGRADHVGIVRTVDGKNFTVIEGNKNNKVDTRSMKTNGRYIRGYCTPKYDVETVQKTESPVSKMTSYTVQKGDTPEKIAKRFAVTVENLIAANVGKYPKMTIDYIRVGWVLNIPAAEAVIGGPYHVSVTAKSGLNVRKAPSTSAEKRGVLTNGTKVDVLGFSEDGGWGMILYKETAGWICLDYVKTV